MSNNKFHSSHFSEIPSIPKQAPHQQIRFVIERVLGPMFLVLGILLYFYSKPLFIICIVLGFIALGIGAYFKIKRQEAEQKQR